MYDAPHHHSSFLIFLLLLQIKNEPLRVRFFIQRLLLAFLYIGTLISSLTGKNHLSHTDVFRSDFDEFIIIDPFERPFQRELAAWRQLDGIIRAGGTGVGQMFLFAWVDIHILITGIFTDDHAFIDFDARFQEKLATVEDRVQAVCGGGAGFESHEGGYLCRGWWSGVHYGSR